MSETKTLTGVHEQYHGATATKPTATLQKWPGAIVAREFTEGVLKPQNLVPKFNNACGPAMQADMICAWSFKPDYPGVVAGKWDVYLTQLAFNVPDGTYIVIWHEPENDMSPARFVELFNHVHDKLKAANPNVITVHAALGYRYRTRGEITHPEHWLTKADINTIDVYSGRSFPASATLPEITGFTRWYEAIGSKGRWGVTERGFVGDSVDTINREAEWMANLADKPELYLVWNTPGTEGDAALVLSSEEETAVQHLFKRLNAEPTPEPTPVPVPTTQTCPLCHGAGTVPVGPTYSITTVAGGQGG